MTNEYKWNKERKRWRKDALIQDAPHELRGLRIRTVCVESGGARVSVGRDAVWPGCVPAIPVDVDKGVIAASAPEAPLHPQKSPNIPHPARISRRSPSHLHPTAHVRRRTGHASTPTPLAALGETSGPRLMSSAWRAANSSCPVVGTRGAQILELDCAWWLRRYTRRFCRRGVARSNSEIGAARRSQWGRQQNTKTTRRGLEKSPALSSVFRHVCKVEREVSGTRARDDKESSETTWRAGNGPAGRLAGERRNGPCSLWYAARRGCEVRGLLGVRGRGFVAFDEEAE
ncbi:hypothetical protein C8J57DRAFT_1229868 [Mycena rebaudengoi]|nr:hypothetical protein C8J57DRAFT_1229868 [Mycena rebaudengoi]